MSSPRKSSTTGGLFEEPLKGGVKGEKNFESGSCDPIPPPTDEGELKRLISSAPPPPDRQFAWPSPISEDEIRDALKRETQKHSCWRGNAVRRMEISDVQCMTALHYSLETFTESRSTCQATESYSVGQFIESFGRNAMMADVDPWEIHSEPSQMFVEEIKVIELPGTTELSACSSCSGQGISHCFHCRGFGTDRCQYCRGTGMKAGIPHPAVVTHPMVATYPHADMSRGYPGTGAAVVRPHGGLAYGKGTPIHFHSLTGIPPPGIGTHDLCYFCHGRGIKECHYCRGHGKKTCTVCGGSGSVRTFTRLKIKYGVERSSEYFDEGNVPEKLLRSVTGEVVLSECHPLVLPLRNYPVEQVNSQSKRLLQIHLNKCLGLCKIIQQRHKLEAVPVAEVTYQLGLKQGKFWVYGQERLCYVPKYPSKCSIL